MPVDSIHPDHAACADTWRILRDVMSGQKAIKAGTVRYLPRLSDQSHEEYYAYLDRALFFNATARTVQGLLGAIFRKPTRVEIVEGLAGGLGSITYDGLPFDVFAKHVTQDVLAMGRYGILVDMPPEESDHSTPYLTGYCAEQIINWRTDRQTSGRAALSMVMLQETHSLPDAKDPFHWITCHRYRMLHLNEEGHYTQTVYEKNEAGKLLPVATFTPVYRGTPFSFIPFVFVGSVSLSPDIEKSPVLDLAYVNLSHYRSSADLEHGRHFTALPTPYVTAPSGSQDAPPSYKIGPSNVWLLEAGGQAGMLEFTGAGLSFLENACREKERMMAVLGARLLEDAKNGVEAAETIRLRAQGESSTLASIADSVSAGLSRALTYWAHWQGAEQPVAVRLNQDFLSSRMAPVEIQSLVAAWQAGALSFDALQSNLRMGEVI